MASLIRVNQLLGRPMRPMLARLIATTPNAKEASSAPTANAAAAASSASGKQQPNKNWVSYGFDFRDEATDRSAMKASYFFSITLCLVWGTFVWSYLPDPQMRNWSQREAHLTLRAREQAGQEPISRDYLNPDQIVLPSEEDLEGVEIII